jgi:hypothetical protein
MGRGPSLFFLLPSAVSTPHGGCTLADTGRQRECTESAVCVASPGAARGSPEGRSTLQSIGLGQV